MNQRKHGVSFELAASIFEDERCLIGPDRIDGTTGEQRWHAIGAVQTGLPQSPGRNIMAKKSSTLSQPARLRSVTSEDTKNRQWTDAERRAVRRISRQQAAGKGSRVNLEDIPRLTDEQLANMVRLRDVRKPKVAVSVRLDPPVLEWLKSKGEGHLTRINDILTRLMEAERGGKRGR